MYTVHTNILCKQKHIILDVINELMNIYMIK